MLTEEKFYEKAKDFVLLKNTDGKYFTLDEYEKLIKENQTDKNKTLVYLYATDKDKQYTFIENAKTKGYDVLIMDGQLDTHFINQLEQKLKDSRFMRVDSDVVDKLIKKDDVAESHLSDEEKSQLSHMFESQLPSFGTFTVQFENMKEADDPVIITQSEFMRRMKDMAAMSGGMNFYGDLPDSYTLVVNSNHKLLDKIIEQKEKKIGSKVNKLVDDLKPFETERDELKKQQKDKKEEEINQAEKDKLSDVEKKIDELNKQKKEMLESYGKENKLVKQLIDLALLANNMLKGEDLTKFVKRSVDLIK